jgi:hypothetical protein
MAPPRAIISYPTKKAIIDAVQSGESKSAILKRFGLKNYSNIWRIMQQKAEIERIIDEHQTELQVHMNLIKQGVDNNDDDDDDGLTMDHSTNGCLGDDDDDDDDMNVADLKLSCIRVGMHKVRLSLKLVTDIADSLKKKIADAKDAFEEMDSEIVDTKEKVKSKMESEDEDDDEEEENDDDEEEEDMNAGTYLAFKELKLQTRMVGNIVDTLRKSFMVMSSEITMLAQIMNATKEDVEEVAAEAVGDDDDDDDDDDDNNALTQKNGLGADIEEEEEDDDDDDDDDDMVDA